MKELPACAALILWTVGCGNEVHERPVLASSSSSSESPRALAAPGSAKAASTPLTVSTASPVKADSVPPPAPDMPLVYAKTRFVWVFPEPNTGSEWIGFLRTGGSVRQKSGRARPGPGCSAFHEVEPLGFVCADGRRATLDAEDRVYRALAPYRAKTDTAWPHSYGESLGLVRYFSTPTLDLQKMREGASRALRSDLEGDLAVPAAAELLPTDTPRVNTGVPELPALPVTVFEDRKELLPRSTVAYSGEARFGNRAFLLSADFAWVPKANVRPYPKVGFKGLRLGSEARLPLALFRKKERLKYTRAPDGSFSPSSSHFDRLGFVELTGNSAQQEGERYLETRDGSFWVREIDAVVPKPQARTPWGATVGSEDKGERVPRGRGTWIEVSIEGGWLLAFEGTRPVYVTLISPGRGGAAKPGENPLDRSATPTGTYSITGKFLTATMEAPGALIHSDVPFAQNIVGPYALHGAYWHDNWGNPQSGGCINLSPIDAKWLFEFTEPSVPDGWHGVRWLPERGPATRVVLHR